HTVVRVDCRRAVAGFPPAPATRRGAPPWGGYISPGSTIDELRIFVSQWDTRARQNGPYRVIHPSATVAPAPRYNPA
ncbi:hypothetical protein ACNJQJ_20860, partial [Mycobacterium tuberculosis]